MENTQSSHRIIFMHNRFYGLLSSHGPIDSVGVKPLFMIIFRETLDTMVPLSGVGSDLSNAMSAIVDDGFAESNGWRRNDQIPSVLVVLTDTLRDDSHYQSLVQVHSKYLNPSYNSAKNLYQIKFINMRLNFADFNV